MLGEFIGGFIGLTDFCKFLFQLIHLKCADITGSLFTGADTAHTGDTELFVGLFWIGH